MPSDNEVMVLIYETVQKQLNQIKDTRVVLQSLANRVSELETTTKSMYERTSDISERVGVLEEAVAAFGGKAAEGLEKAAAAGVRMKDAADAMRSTLENVTNPSISLVSGNHAALKEAVRSQERARRNTGRVRAVRAEDAQNGEHYRAASEKQDTDDEEYGDKG